MRKPLFLFFTLMAGLVVAGLGFYSASEFGKDQLKNSEISVIGAAVAGDETGLDQDPEVIFPHTVPSKSSLSVSLRSLGISAQTVHQIVEAARPVFDLARLPSGVRFRLQRGLDGEGVQEIEFLFSRVDSLRVYQTATGWSAEKKQEPVDTRVRTFVGVLESTLWESALEANMDPNLITDLSEVFGSQIDFNREVRVNDRWRISVEEHTVRGQHFKWGSILAAEYVNAGESHTALLYRVGGRSMGYYNPKGESLRKMFLKSPIKFGRISSRFQRARFHPILKVKRPHLGVDYAAPTGTPVRSVGDGVIAESGWRGGGGLSIRIRHAGTYQTAYRHLSRIAKGIRPGARVQQGDLIGFVGSTGLSTAPHLHFEFFVNGKFVDPLGQKFPAAEPLNRAELEDFSKSLPQLIASLPNWDGSLTGSSEVTIRAIVADASRIIWQPSPLLAGAAPAALEFQRD